VPLIFRPDPAGTWLASFALPTSKYATPAAAPGVVPGSDLLLEGFSPAGNATGGREVAAYLFYTIELATQADYERACAALEAALPALGLAPVEGAWREAWVTYSTQAIVGDRINECWIEAAAKRGRAAAAAAAGAGSGDGGRERGDGDRSAGQLGVETTRIDR